MEDTPSGSGEIRREQASLVEQFVREYRTQLLMLAARLVGRDHADDVARQAFVHLAQRIAKRPLPEVMALLRSPPDLRKLMYRITLCRAFEHLAQQRAALGQDAAPISLRALEARDDATCALMAAAASVEIEAGRDVDEFCEIVEQHKAHLVRVALRLSGETETAKDLVQETLARAWSRFGQFTHGTNARAWLVTILMRLFYDHLKHARVITKAEAEIRTLEPAACDMMPRQIPDAQLWAAVEALEPDLRGVVERCYLQDMSYKAIAEELKVPIGTIGTRLRRARERLKLLLDADGLGEP